MSKQKYDTTQIERHQKRTRGNDKVVKEMLYHLDLMLGEQGTGYLLSMVCDCLDKMMNEVTPSDYMELRTIEIRFNDFYSVKFDCETEQYVK